jgi:hypothetical protein
VSKKYFNIIIGQTGTLKIDENISLSGYFSCLVHVKQETTIDGKAQNKPLTNINLNLFTSSLRIIYFLETNFLLNTFF